MRIRIFFSGLCNGQFQRIRTLQGSSRSYSNAFSPLELRFEPSYRLPALVVGAHILALAAIFYSDLPKFTLTICTALVALSATHSLKGFIKPGRDDTVVGLSWYPDRKQLALVLLSGAQLQVDELRQKLVIPGVIVLSLVPEGRLLPIWLMLTPDQMSAEEWRRLAIVIKWAPPPQRDASGQG
ncbi:protein YgfX [Marinobacterium ramblicola]|uniref:protein YgfX n=1 Tax=Marinobacterium ramblicola TaxID=2849041 RepID=UPI003CCE6CDC